MPYEPSLESQDLRPPHGPKPGRTVLQWLSLGLALAVAGACAVLIGSVFLEARDAVRKATCRANMNQVSTALTMYVADYSERMPPAQRWSDCVYPYVKNWEVFRCTARPSSPGGFAFNRLLSNRPLAELNSETLSPAIFESSIGTLNATDELQSFITPHIGESCLINSTGWIQRVSIAPSAAAGIRSRKPSDKSKP